MGISHIPMLYQSMSALKIFKLSKFRNLQVYKALKAFINKLWKSSEKRTPNTVSAIPLTTCLANCNESIP